MLFRSALLKMTHGSSVPETNPFQKTLIAGGGSVLTSCEIPACAEFRFETRLSITTAATASKNVREAIAIIQLRPGALDSAVGCAVVPLPEAVAFAGPLARAEEDGQRDGQVDGLGRGRR